MNCMICYKGYEVVFVVVWLLNGLFVVNLIIECVSGGLLLCFVLFDVIDFFFEEEYVFVYVLCWGCFWVDMNV